MFERPKQPMPMRRRPFQFSLRTLFIVMTLAAVLMSMVARPWREYRREQAVLTAIGPGKASVVYNYVPVFGSDLCSTVLGTTLYRRVVGLKLNALPPKEFDLDRLAELRHLRELCLQNLPVDDDRLAGLHRLDGLEELDLSGTQVTDAGLAHIEGLKKLQRVDAIGTRISYAALGQLQSKLPEAQDLCHLRAVGELAAARADVQTKDYDGRPGSIGHAFRVWFSRRYQDADLEHLSYLPQLNTLWLSNATTDESLRLLPDLEAVEELAVDSWKLNGEGLKHLVRFKRLKRLRLDGARFDKAGVKQLAQLKSLEELQLLRTRFTGLDLTYLQQLPLLRKLVITETPYIYDIDLPLLAEMKRLEELTLDGVRASDAGIDRLRAAMPNVRIAISHQTIPRPPDMGPPDESGTPVAAVDAFWAGDFDRMAAAYRELDASPDASWQSDLWLGHAEQLAGRWAEAVAAYRNVLGQFDRELLEIPPTAPAQRSRVALLENWAQLLALVGRIELDELDDPVAAAATLAQSLRYTPEADRPMDVFVDETAKALERLESPRSRIPDSFRLWTKWMHPVATYRLLAEALERRGDVLAAVECWIRIRLCNLACGQDFIKVDPNHIARLWAQLPADRPTPPIAIFLAPTPEQPAIQRWPGSGHSRLTHWDRTSAWGHYAIVPPPGRCIDVLHIKCEGNSDDATTAASEKKAMQCWLIDYSGAYAKLPIPVIHDEMQDGDDQRPTRFWTKEFRAETPADKDVLFVNLSSESPRRIVISCEYRPRSESSSPPEEPTSTLLPAEPSMTTTFRPIAPDTTRFHTTRYKASALVRMPDGRLLAAFGSEDDKILFSRSPDGVAWEEPYEYSGNGVFLTLGPSLAVDGDGLIRMVYVSKCPGIDRFSTGYYYVWTARSEDGRTWTDRTPERMPYWPQHRGTTSIVRAPDGRYWTFRDGYAGVGLSTGDAWELLRLDLPVRSDSLSPANPHATFDPNGRCHLVFDDFGRTLQYTWSDDMQSWSELKTLAGKTRISSAAHPQLLLDGDRVALLYTTNRGIHLCRGTLTPDGLSLGNSEQIVDYRDMIEGFRLLREEEAVYLQVQGDPPRLLRADLDELFGTP